MDLRLGWYRDRRPELLLGARDACVAPRRETRRAARPVDAHARPVGAEPVDPKAVEAFVAAAEPFGFDAGAVFPAFGMAETAIGASFPQRGAGLQCDTVDREVLERTRVAKPIEVTDPDDLAVRARRLPMLGTAVPGMELKVVDPDTRETLPERHVGELLLRGTSVTPGYYKRDDATRALFHDDWLCTGDLAYVLDGQLILCGRIKDVIIVGGRNVFPEDIERRGRTRRRAPAT
ncbi:MAG: AMP-binding protein [Ilumatobacteraceae bacterium]